MRGVLVDDDEPAGRLCHDIRFVQLRARRAQRRFAVRIGGTRPVRFEEGLIGSGVG